MWGTMGCHRLEWAITLGHKWNVIESTGIEWDTYTILIGYHQPNILFGFLRL